MSTETIHDSPLRTGCRSRIESIKVLQKVIIVTGTYIAIIINAKPKGIITGSPFEVIHLPPGICLRIVLPRIGQILLIGIVTGSDVPFIPHRETCSGIPNRTWHIGTLRPPVIVDVILPGIGQTGCFPVVTSTDISFVANRETGSIGTCHPVEVRTAIPDSCRIGSIFRTGAQAKKYGTEYQNSGPRPIRYCFFYSSHSFILFF